MSEAKKKKKDADVLFDFDEDIDDEEEEEEKDEDEDEDETGSKSQQPEQKTVPLPQASEIQMWKDKAQVERREAKRLQDLLTKMTEEGKATASEIVGLRQEIAELKARQSLSEQAAKQKEESSSAGPGAAKA